MFNNTQKKFIFKKIFKLKIKNLKYNVLGLGIIAVRALQSTRLEPNQMETIRRLFVRATLRMGRIWLKNKINFKTSKKSQGSRMGKGVGSFKDWVIETKLGQIIVEFSFVDFDPKELLIKMAKKMPISVDFIFKNYKY